MPCNDCSKTRSEKHPLRAPETPSRGLGKVTIVYTGGPVEAIWQGLRAALPADSDHVTLDDDGTIRYTKNGPGGDEPPGPPEGFEVVDDWTFRSLWKPCRGQAFIAEVQECGCLNITTVCFGLCETFGNPVSLGQCERCENRQATPPRPRPFARDGEGLAPAYPPNIHQ